MSLSPLIERIDTAPDGCCLTLGSVCGTATLLRRELKRAVRT